MRWTCSTFLTLRIFYCIPIDKCDCASKLLKSWRLVEYLFTGMEPKMGPTKSWLYPILKSLIYSNITVKYSIKAVNWPCCAQPTYKYSYVPACNTFDVQHSISSNFDVHIMICIAEMTVLGCMSSLLVIIIIINSSWKRILHVPHSNGLSKAGSYQQSLASWARCL